MKSCCSQTRLATSQMLPLLARAFCFSASFTWNLPLMLKCLLVVFEIAGLLVTAEGCYVCRCARLLHIFPSLGYLPASPHFSFWKCSMRGVPFSFLPLELNGRVETMEAADCWKDDCVLKNRTWLSLATSSLTKSNNVTLQFWDFYWTIPFSFFKKNC